MSDAHRRIIRKLREDAEKDVEVARLKKIETAARAWQAVYRTRVVPATKHQDWMHAQAVVNTALHAALDAGLQTDGE